MNEHELRFLIALNEYMLERLLQLESAFPSNSEARDTVKGLRSLANVVSVLVNKGLN